MKLQIKLLKLQLQTNPIKSLKDLTMKMQAALIYKRLKTFMYPK